MVTEHVKGSINIRMVGTHVTQGIRHFYIWAYVYGTLFALPCRTVTHCCS
jgi:hypothetical protein